MKIITLFIEEEKDNTGTRFVLYNEGDTTGIATEKEQTIADSIEHVMKDILETIKGVTIEKNSK